MSSRRNLCPNPSLTNNNTGWGGGSTPARITGVTGMVRTTAAHYTSSAGGGFAQLPTGVASPGVAYTCSVYVRPDAGSLGVGSSTLYLAFTRSAGGDDFSNTASIGSIAAGVVQRITITATAPANTTGLYLLHDGVNFTVVNVDYTGALYEAAGSLDTFFDGDSPGGSWDGTSGNSSSTLTSGTTYDADSAASTTAALAAVAVKTAEAATAVSTTATLSTTAVKVAEAANSAVTTAALSTSAVVAAEGSSAAVTTAALTSVGAVTASRTAALTTVAGLSATATVSTPGAAAPPAVRALVTTSRSVRIVTTSGGAL